MRLIEKFLLNFLLSFVIIVFISGGGLKSSSLSATFFIAILLIFVNRIIINFRNAKS